MHTFFKDRVLLHTEIIYIKAHVCKPCRCLHKVFNKNKFKNRLVDYYENLAMGIGSEVFGSGQSVKRQYPV